MVEDLQTGLVLRELAPGDEAAFVTAVHEWPDEERDWFTFVLTPGMSFESMLEVLSQQKHGRRSGIPHTMLYGFVDGEIVGRVSVRHELDDRLRERGGHLGYSVAERYRRRGFATEMVRQGLAYCRSLGLRSLMVSCAETNVASWRIIEKYGGVLEDKPWDATEEEWTRRYWIDLALIR